MGRRGIIGVAAVAMLLCTATPAQAETTVIDFDELAPGTTVTSQSGVNFSGEPTVFKPVNVATFTPPNALHTQGSCGGGVCPSGAHKLEITFDKPAGSVSWRVGLDDETAETEFGEAAELVVYNADGTPVGTSGEMDLGFNTYQPITTEVGASSESADIVRAVLTVGVGGTPPRRVNVDHLVFTDESVPLAPPTVRITTPLNRQEFDRTEDIRVSGSVTAPAGLLRFCLSTHYMPPSFPAQCRGLGSLAPDGTFTNLRVGPFVSGNNYIAAWVEDRRFRKASASITVELRQNDLRVTNIEVNQGTQPWLPNPTPADNDDVAHTAEYNGVQLISHKSTAVRVWTAARLDAAGTPVRGASVYLYGEKADGTPLRGSPVPAIEGTRDLGPSLSYPTIDARARSDPSSSWTFVVPYSWQLTGGPITLRAVVNPPHAFPRVNECDGCGANNTLRLTGVRFQRPGTLDIWPFRVIWRDGEGTLKAPPERPYATFREVRKMSPFHLEVHPYQGVINAQAIAEDTSLDGDGMTSAIYDRLTDAVDIMGYPGFLTLAVNRGLGPGVTSEHFSWSSFTIRTYAVVNDLRPFTSVAHEIYHGIEFDHAGRNCDDAVGRGGAEPWIPDERGLTQSIGADVSSLFGPPPRRLKLFGFFDEEGNPIEYFDFMSYCAGEGSSWISALNWFRSVGEVARHGRASRAVASGNRAEASAAGPNLGVTASIGAGGGQILRVEPRGGRVTDPVPTSDVIIRVRNGAGGIVSDTPVLARPTHIDTGGTGTNVVQVSAVVPAARGRTVELLKSGAVLDTHSRSNSTPKVRLIAPRKGARVGSRRALRVRWRARDANRDPLLASLDFSANGGRRWRPVATGLKGRKFALPLSYLARSRNARLRVRVSDGWNETASVSGRFSVAGPAPQVSIELPRNRTRLRADEPLNLEGIAFDDRSRALEGRSVKWFDGRRLLGRGTRTTVLSLRPGRHTIRLVARDRSGRAGQAKVRVIVTRVKPTFLVLRAPKSVSRRARRVAIRAAASLPGTLAIGRTRYKIDRRTRRFRVRVKRGRKPLRLRLVLRAGGRTTRATLRIRRR
ncbi:MAG TPA: hypothetical protein VFZ41_07355 [Solirubrobacterales bacterium]